MSEIHEITACKELAVENDGSFTEEDLRYAISRKMESLGWKPAHIEWKSAPYDYLPNWEIPHRVMARCLWFKPE